MNVIFKNCDYVDLANEMRENDVKVDLLFTDPPYCISRDYQLGFSNMGRAGMNYGKRDYDFDQRKRISDVADLVKNGGSIIIFNDWKNLSYLVEELEKNGFIIKDLIRWEKTNPMPRNVNSRYLSDCEFAVWAVKGKGKWTFNKPTDAPFLKPVYKSGVVLGGNKRIHPTQKSLSVIENILCVHSNEGDLVFDPFSGSGTTALGCIHLKRRFIGSEIDPTYYEKAKKRLCL